MRKGTVNVIDTSFMIWEDHVDESSFLPVMEEIHSHLISRGFDMRSESPLLHEYDADFELRHDIALRHRYGKKRYLEVSLRLSGRCLEVMFFQNCVTENRHGGKYDSNKFKKMPYLIKLSYLVEASQLLDMLLSQYGYTLERRLLYCEGTFRQRLIAAATGLNAHVDPLRSFNERWGSERFQRDSSGWPIETAYVTRASVDLNGKPLRKGMTRYYRDAKGYLHRGIIYPVMNDRWMVVESASVQYVSSWDLFELSPGVSRRKRVSLLTRKARLKQQLGVAIAAMNFELAAVLRDILLSENLLCDECHEQHCTVAIDGVCVRLM